MYSVRAAEQWHLKAYQPVVLGLVVAYVPLVNPPSMAPYPQLYPHKSHESRLRRQLSVFFNITESVDEKFRSAKDTTIPIQCNKSLCILLV